jgi:ferrochelatase
VSALLDGQPSAFAYQSQGRSSEAWLGPTVEATLDQLAQAGRRHLLVAPIGFLCDHVETLYDIDIELKQLAASRGVQLERIAMLNDAAALVETLAVVVAAHESSLAIPS